MRGPIALALALAIALAAPPVDGKANAELVRFIQAAGRTPVQRDSLYNEIRRW